MLIGRRLFFYEIIPLSFGWNQNLNWKCVKSAGCITVKTENYASNLWNVFLHSMFVCLFFPPAFMRGSTRCSCGCSPTRGSTRPSWTTDDGACDGTRSGVIVLTSPRTGNKNGGLYLYYYWSTFSVTSLRVEYLSQGVSGFWIYDCWRILDFAHAEFQRPWRMMVGNASLKTSCWIFPWLSCRVDQLLQLYPKRRGGCRSECGDFTFSKPLSSIHSQMPSSTITLKRGANK